MPLLEYERIRKAEAKKLGMRASTLDKIVAALRPREETGLQGTAVKLADVEPWPKTVNAAEVLDAVAERFAQYVVLPECAADVLALWCAHTHAFKVFQCSPRLNVSSPEKGCGKTTLRDVAARFVSRPVSTEKMTTAVLFRLVHSQSPSVLADECDTWLAENEDLKSLFNSGHRRSDSKVFRCEGDNNELRAFDVFAPAVLCGIGNLPGTLHERSIVVRLERAKRGEIKARFDSRHVEVENELCRKLARFCTDNRAELEASDPDLPENVFNRLADNWRPLFAIAEVAGGDWPKRCADALAKLTKRATDDVETLCVMLLTEIREIFAATWPPLPEGVLPSPVDRIFSRDLIDKLSEMKERPWPEVCRGKPIIERWLARSLGAFGIRPKLLRISDADKPARGYEIGDFRDAFTRYLPEGVHRYNTRENAKNLSVTKTKM